MKIGELIDDLKDLQTSHGWDMPVRVHVSTGPGAWQVLELESVSYSYAGSISGTRRGEVVSLETVTINRPVQPTT